MNGTRKKRGFWLLVIATLILSLACCSPNENKAQTTSIAKAYLKQHGYRIISHESSIEPHILKREALGETFLMKIWQVQTADVEKYIGKEIYSESFIVKKHPLDEKGTGKTHVYVMIVDGEVIGGTSSPVTDEPLRGGAYSLDGRTFEEIRPDVNWKKWADEWAEKYRS